MAVLTGVGNSVLHISRGEENKRHKSKFLSSFLTTNITPSLAFNAHYLS